MSSRELYVASMKLAFSTLGKSIVTKYLYTAVPWLNVPFVRTLVEYIIGKAFDALTTHTEMSVFFRYIDTRVGTQSAGFEKAAYENYEAQRGNDELAKKHAETNLKKQFATFAHLAS